MLHEMDKVRQKLAQPICRLRDRLLHGLNMGVVSPPSIHLFIRLIDFAMKPFTLFLIHRIKLFQIRIVFHPMHPFPMNTKSGEHGSSSGPWCENFYLIGWINSTNFLNR